MSSNGIVRRVDELGRIVVPKELRRSLRISVGTPIEISASDGKIILSKYSTTRDIHIYAEGLCAALSRMLDCGAIITDTDVVTSVAGASRKAYLGANISRALDEFKSKSPTILRRMDGSVMIPIIDGDREEYTSEIIYPISYDGQVISILVLFTTKDRVLEASEVAICKFISHYLNEIMNIE